MKQKIFFRLTIALALFGILSGCQKIGRSGEASTTTEASVCNYQVVATYPHDSDAFTQGLIYDRGNLYESTGLNGESSVRKVDLETGEVLEISELEERYFGEGMTRWQNKLIQLTWVSKTGFVYDLETFEQIDTFTYSTQGWGLTHDNNELILSDGSDTLYFLNPETFEQTRQIKVTDSDRPVDKINELEFVNGEILANVWMSDRLARIDPETGEVKGWIDLTGIYEPNAGDRQNAVLNGIAYDEEKDRLFVTGKLWSKLFEIDLTCP